jgi:hypothetical protein
VNGYRVYVASGLAQYLRVMRVQGELLSRGFTPAYDWAGL